MVGEPNRKRLDEITRNDVARWFDVDVRLVRMHQEDVKDISDFWQWAYTQFFAMVDSGEIRITFDKHGKKTLVRGEKPTTPVKKTPRPFVDLATMKLGFDR